MQTLQTERLNLRGWHAADFEAYAAYMADADTARYVGGACDRAEAWQRFAAMVGHWQLRGYGFWAVTARDGGAFLGCVGLWFPEGWPDLELGYWLVREAWGRGYAYEAALCARAHAYAVLGAKRLVSYIDPHNQPSIALARRLGCTLSDTIELCTHGPHHVFLHPTEA